MNKLRRDNTPVPITGMDKSLGGAGLATPLSDKGPGKNSGAESVARTDSFDDTDHTEEGE